MAGRLNVAVEPNADLPFHVVLPSIALRSRKDAVPDFPHQAGHHPRHMIAVLLNGFDVWLVAQLPADILKFFQKSATSLKLSNASLLAILAVPVLMLTLVSYAVLSFPFVARQFGGGHKTIIDVVLSEPAPDSWDRLGIPISVDRSLVGPVALLFESQRALVVTRRVALGLVAPPPKELVTVIAPPVHSVAIERKGIAGIIYRGLRYSE